MLRRIKNLVLDLKYSPLGYRDIWPLYFWEGSQFEGSAYDAIEAYCLLFCLSRADRFQKFSEAEISELGKRLALEICGDHVTGARLQRAINFKEIELKTVNKLVKYCSPYPDLIPFINYARAKYVGFKPSRARRHDGDLHLENYSVVFNNNHYLRDEGAIYTYGQQCCTIIICRKQGLFGLGHYQTSRYGEPNLKIRELLEPYAWQKIYVVSYQPENVLDKIRSLCKLSDIYVHKKELKDMYAIKVDSSRVTYEHHMLDHPMQHPYGVVRAMPRRDYQLLEFKHEN